MATFALLGDSYIERLRRYCADDMSVPGRVYFFGKGGLRTDRVPEHLWRKVLSTNIDVILINAGGNDISTTSSPKEICRRICEMAESLYRSGVKKVYIAEILTRGDFRKCPGLTKQVFDEQRRYLNGLLMAQFGQNFVRFKDIHFPKDYDADLVHLGTSEKLKRNSGMRKFQSRIRRIFCSYKRRM